MPTAAPSLDYKWPLPSSGHYVLLQASECNIQHSWYLSPELTALALFSTQLTNEEKTQIVENITPDRGSHLLTKLPASFSEVHISKTFFEVTQIDDDFLKIPAVEWPATQSFKEAIDMVSKLDYN